MTEIIAHASQNVNFAAQNVKRRRAANRSETAGRGTKTQRVRHGLGERKSCKRYKKSCNAYRWNHNAWSAAEQRGRFSGIFERFFREINPPAGFTPGLYTKLSKPNAPWWRYFRPRGWAVGFAGILEVKKCKKRDCTLYGATGLHPAPYMAATCHLGGSPCAGISSWPFCGKSVPLPA